jgi:hypothetical protein
MIHRIGLILAIIAIVAVMVVPSAVAADAMNGEPTLIENVGSRARV